jgi:hypothetical protein
MTVQQKTIQFAFLIAALLSACAAEPKITASMTTAMLNYADWYEAQYPAETISTARTCATAPSAMMYNAEINTYIVTCKMPGTPTGYGIVFITAGAVTSTCGIDANSQHDLENIFRGLGYR